MWINVEVVLSEKFTPLPPNLWVGSLQRATIWLQWVPRWAMTCRKNTLTDAEGHEIHACSGLMERFITQLTPRSYRTDVATQIGRKQHSTPFDLNLNRETIFSATIIHTHTHTQEMRGPLALAARRDEDPQMWSTLTCMSFMTGVSQCSTPIGSWICPRCSCISGKRRPAWWRSFPWRARGRSSRTSEPGHTHAHTHPHSSIRLNKLSSDAGNISICLLILYVQQPFCRRL